MILDYVYLSVIYDSLTLIFAPILFIHFYKKRASTVISIILLQFIWLMAIYPFRSIIFHLTGFSAATYLNLSIEAYFYAAIIGNTIIWLYTFSYIFFSKIKISPAYLIEKKFSDFESRLTYIPLFFLYIISIWAYIDYGALYSHINATAEVVNMPENSFFSYIFSLRFFFLIYLFGIKKKYGFGKYSLITVLIIEIILALTSGSKHGLVYIFLIYLFVFNNWNIFRVRYALLGIFLLVISTAFSELYRYGQIVNIDDNIISNAIRLLIEFFNVDILVGALTIISSRLHGIDSLAAIIDKFPNQTDYFLGASYINIFYAFIPRLLWIDKPEITYGLWFGREIFELPVPTGVAFWFPGELYMNFGILGIFIVPIYTLFFIFLDKKFLSSKSILGVMIGAQVLTFFRYMEFSLISIISGAIVSGIFLVCVLVFTKIINKILLILLGKYKNYEKN